MTCIPLRKLGPQSGNVPTASEVLSMCLGLPVLIINCVLLIRLYWLHIYLEYVFLSSSQGKAIGHV